MKEFLNRAMERFTKVFSYLDYSADRNVALEQYAKHRGYILNGVVDPADDFPKIADGAAMRLVAGMAYQVDVDLWRVTVHDKSVGTRFDAPLGPFAAYGWTQAAAEARAAQLVSALDGARRL